MRYELQCDGAVYQASNHSYIWIHFHIVIIEQYSTTVSLCHFTICHTVTLSPCHPVTLSPCHTFTLSPCNTVTQSASHTVTMTHLLCHYVYLILVTFLLCHTSMVSISHSSITLLSLRNSSVTQTLFCHSDTLLSLCDLSL